MTSPQNKPQSPTNKQEKMRDEWRERWDEPKVLTVDGVADWWLAKFTAHQITLLEQMIVENEGRKYKREDVEERLKNDPDGYIFMTAPKWEAHNSALDLINTDLRAKIEELKKQV